MAQFGNRKKKKRDSVNKDILDDIAYADIARSAMVFISFCKT